MLIRMAAAEKRESIENILDKNGSHISNYFADLSAKGNFEERLKAFRDFHNPSYGFKDKLKDHSRYVVEGHPDKPDEFPGAYNSAKNVLDKIVGDYDALGKDKVTEVMETYVDKFLDHLSETKNHVGKDLEEAKKKGPESLREVKGQLFSKYASRNLLHKDEIDKNVGKTKSEVVKYLDNVSEETADAYLSVLEESVEDLLSNEEDSSKLAEVMEKEFEIYDHKESLPEKGIKQLRTEYAAHLKSDRKALAEHGYQAPKKVG